MPFCKRILILVGAIRHKGTVLVPFLAFFLVAYTCQESLTWDLQPCVYSKNWNSPEYHLTFLPGCGVFSDPREVNSFIFLLLSYRGPTEIWGLKRPHNLFCVGFLTTR